MKVKIAFTVEVCNKHGSYKYTSKSYDTPDEALNAVRVVFLNEKGLKPKELKDYTYKLIVTTRQEYMSFPMNWKITKKV